TRIAGAYFDVVAATEQLKIVETQVAANADLLELIELRYENSESTALDVLQQRQQVAASQTMPAQARVQLRNAQVQLGILVGNIEDSVATSKVLPVLPGPPPTSVPGDVVEARPDLRAASNRLDGAHRRKLSAFRALLPTLQISGQAGYQANYFTEFDTQSTWGVGYSLSVPMFQGGRGHAAIRQARAAEDGASHAYSQLVLQALGEVELALTLEAEQNIQLAAVEKQVEAARLAYQESRSQYALGLTNYLSILVALNTLQQAELSELSVRRQLLNSRVQLHDALGGDLPTFKEEHQP
ncbi:MAG: TolC family protein, partial [Proteobacteria bacterium]|nr:TolC family protein [Pseudomonadota bacterium]